MVQLAPSVAPDARLAKLALRSIKARGLMTLVNTIEGPQDIVLQGDALVDGDVVLYFAAVANLHVAIYVYVLPIMQPVPMRRA